MDYKKYLLRAVELSEESVEQGNTPFAALLVDDEGNILLEQMNNELSEHKCTGHAETQLAERASHLYDKEFLRKCTMVTTVEPCAMCTGALYWSNIGRLVYGLEETELLKMTGNDDVNPTLNLPCREIISKGQREIEVVGPFEDLKEDIARIHKTYWKNAQE